MPAPIALGAIMTLSICVSALGQGAPVTMLGAIAEESCPSDEISDVISVPQGTAHVTLRYKIQGAVYRKYKCVRHDPHDSNHFEAVTYGAESYTFTVSDANGG